MFVNGTVSLNTLQTLTSSTPGGPHGLGATVLEAAAKALTRTCLLVLSEIMRHAEASGSCESSGPWHLGQWAAACLCCLITGLGDWLETGQ